VDPSAPAAAETPTCHEASTHRRPPPAGRPSNPRRSGATRSGTVSARVPLRREGGRAEKAQHVSDVIDERVERGRADGLAERDRHDVARQPHVAATRPSTRATGRKTTRLVTALACPPTNNWRDAHTWRRGSKALLLVLPVVPRQRRTRRRRPLGVGGGPERVRPVRSRSHHPGGLPRPGVAGGQSRSCSCA
jgi:hypothetical protein